MLQTGRALRKLGKKDMYRLLRWGPMAVADLVAEFLRPNSCAPPLPRAASLGRYGPMVGGSSLVLLIRAAAITSGGLVVLRARGTGAITQAMSAAAKEAARRFARRRK